MNGPRQSAVIKCETLHVSQMKLDRRAALACSLDSLRQHHLAAIHADYAALGTDQLPQGDRVYACAATCFEHCSSSSDSQQRKRSRIERAEVPRGDGLEESNQRAGICGVVDTREGLNRLGLGHDFRAYSVRRRSPKSAISLERPVVSSRPSVLDTGHQELTSQASAVRSMSENDPNVSAYVAASCHRLASMESRSREAIACSAIRASSQHCWQLLV